MVVIICFVWWNGAIFCISTGREDFIVLATLCRTHDVRNAKVAPRSLTAEWESRRRYLAIFRQAWHPVCSLDA